MAETTSSPAVLVVEDEVLIRMSIADSLEEAGFTVYEAANADQAIKLLEVHQDIRVLFTDIDMPGSMDGLRLAEAVRNRWPPVKIIITSGHVKIRQEELPVDGHFFAKPYDAALVVSAMRNLVGPKRH
jgi:CheY-like chemotaxis protein